MGADATDALGVVDGALLSPLAVPLIEIVQPVRDVGEPIRCVHVLGENGPPADEATLVVVEVLGRFFVE